MADYYVRKMPSTSLRDDNDQFLTQLLWGDPVKLKAAWTSNSTWAYVAARGFRGWVKKSHLKKRSSSFNGLLEFYVIDVGQGDAVLCRTPDDRWHLINAGVPNAKQMTKKGAANFLRWKFYEDLQQRKIKLHSMTASHPDYDHYGGMIDLLSGRLFDGRTFNVEVDNFYHSGMGRFSGSSPLGRQRSGTVASFPEGSHGLQRNDRFIVGLLDDLNSFANPPLQFTEGFQELADLLVGSNISAKRLSTADRYMPGYGPSENDVSIRILGPVVESFAGNEGLRRLGSEGRWESKTRNGHSIVYRFDYANARILLTGDLNEESQRLLLSYIPPREYNSDVAKGCHHGSDDVNMDFIKAMKARTTVVSSGDNETYAHPRPQILGASARYGRESKAPNGEVLAPLIYSTELARSVALDYATSVRLDPDASGPQTAKRYSAKSTTIKTKRTKYRRLKNVPISTNLVYGLINVRTDGRTILCAYMKEAGNSFDTRLFKAGVNV